MVFEDPRPDERIGERFWMTSTSDRCEVGRTHAPRDTCQWRKAFRGVMLRLPLRNAIFLGMAFSFPLAAQADARPRQATSDQWDAAYLDGTKSGYVHTQVTC